MKTILVLSCLAIVFSSCSLFKKSKYGCPTNGKNIGAERLLSGDPAATRAASKASKFKGIN